MPITLFKGNGPCPACKRVIAELDRAGIQFNLNEDNGALFGVGSALGVSSRPILVWYAVGAGLDATHLIKKRAEGWTSG
jgi:hypothetical protein